PQCRECASGRSRPYGLWPALLPAARCPPRPKSGWLQPPPEASSEIYFHHSRFFPFPGAYNGGSRALLKRKWNSREPAMINAGKPPLPIALFADQRLCTIMEALLRYRESKGSSPPGRTAGFCGGKFYGPLPGWYPEEGQARILQNGMDN